MSVTFFDLFLVYVGIDILHETKLNFLQVNFLPSFYLRDSAIIITAKF